MQLTWSRIWTCVAVSISYNNNHYTTGTFHDNISIRQKKKSYAVWFLTFLKEILTIVYIQLIYQAQNAFKLCSEVQTSLFDAILSFH